MKIKLSRNTVMYYSPSYEDIYDNMYGDSFRFIVPAEETFIKYGREVSRRSLSSAEKRKYKRFWKRQADSGLDFRRKYINAIKILYKN